MSGDRMVLVIEDDEVLGGAVVQRLKLEGFEPVWAKSCAEAIRALQRGRPAFVLSDIRLPDGSGEDVFRRAQPYLGGTPIIFATAYGEVDQAVRLVKAGANDYLTKPYDIDALVERIRSLLAPEATRNADAEDAHPVPMAGIDDRLAKAARADLPVLLTGETGVGKEVAARLLHSASTRADRPFVAVNCGAIPHDLLESQFFGHERGAFTGAAQSHAGFFEEADGGTLFLDEIGELDARLQAALLRVLEDGIFRPVGGRADRKFRGRIVAATNADLGAMRDARTFRDDLYYRLSVIEIAIPPLRERLDEIVPLANAFLGGSRFELSREAIDAMLAHEWPGNVRELKNRIERARVFADTPLLEPADLFPERRLDDHPAGTLAEARQRADADQIERALAASEGRVGEAAKRLGISRTTLWKRRARKGDG